MKIILVEDALYANAPHIRQIIGYDWNDILNVKPDWRENALGYFPLEDATDSPLTREVSTAYPDALCALTDAWLFMRNEARLQATTENWLCHRAVTSVAFALDDWPESFFRFCDEFDMAALENLQRQLGLEVSYVERLVEQGKLRIERMHTALEAALEAAGEKLAIFDQNRDKDPMSMMR